MERNERGDAGDAEGEAQRKKLIFALRHLLCVLCGSVFIKMVVGVGS